MYEAIPVPFPVPFTGTVIENGPATYGMPKSDDDIRAALMALQLDTSRRSALVHATIPAEIDNKLRTAGAKPDLAIIPMEALLGTARVLTWGGLEYAPGNFHAAHLSDGAGPRYISAGMRHLMGIQLPSGLHTELSLATLDDKSGLPHIDHAIASLLILRSIITKCAALPADPGPGKNPKES